MAKLEDMITELRVSELLKKNESGKRKKIVFWVLLSIGILAAAAAVGYGVYRFLAPGKLDEFEDDFEDEYDAYFNDAEDFLDDVKETVEEKVNAVKEKAEDVAENVKDAVE